jgi:Peptidase family M23
MKIKLILLLQCFAGLSFAQSATVAGYPLNYFRNPLEIPMLLAGNFGECRPDHFHSGLDIKTFGQENLPVHAAAEGYVSRIKMEKGGFGHALYITHPNGYTTLYAHLNNFAPALQAFISRKQYEARNWEQDITIPPNEFTVTKGQLIAYSGNTGGSTAPHLHFEIRDTKTEHPLNPQLFGFPITDNIPPLPYKAVLFYGNIFHDAILPLALAKHDTHYKPVNTPENPAVIVRDTVMTDTSSSLGIGLEIDDFMDGSTNTLNIYSLQLLLDDSIQSEIVLNDISYDISRYVNAYMDYKEKFLSGHAVQLLFQLPGNKLKNIYSHLNPTHGRLPIADHNAHKITIIATDDAKNTARIEFYVKQQDAHIKNAANCQVSKHNRVNNFNDGSISFIWDNMELYDDICFSYEKYPYINGMSDKFAVAEPYIPVHHFFDLKIKANKNIPEGLEHKICLRYSDGKTEEGKAAIPLEEQGWYAAKVRQLGTYWLIADTIAPTIRLINANNEIHPSDRQISFEVRDKETSVKHFEGLLDGNWICFEQHEDLFFYNFDEHCTKGNHKLEFIAEDENGNKGQYEIKFTR